MDEVDLLIEKAESKFNSAKILFENGVYDDAVSRAYYCMYYAAKALLSLKDIYPRTHRGVLSQFSLEFVKTGVIEEYYAKQLQRHRKEGNELTMIYITDHPKRRQKQYFKMQKSFSRELRKQWTS